MAQWKSVPFTPERSLVRSQLGPQYKPPGLSADLGVFALVDFEDWANSGGVGGYSSNQEFLLAAAPRLAEKSIPMGTISIVGTTSAQPQLQRPHF